MTTKQTDLSTLTPAELRILRRKVDQALAGKTDLARKRKALAAAQAAAEAWGFHLADLMDLSRSPLAGVRIPPKFRDPASRTNVWSGRGRPPQWFVAAVETGITPEAMRIRPD
ncbi:DNA-binding protein H-NS [Rubellimicrobium aerolatum]|nr:DNA-binding protein H-NS [Rubellimicrobium aerolatum]